MRSKLLYMGAVMILASLVSCQNEDDAASTYLSDANTVKVNILLDGMDDGVATRANSEETGDEWSNGDMIRVTNVSANAVNGKKMAEYAYADGIWNIKGTSYMVWVDGNNSFEGCYPNNANTSFVSFVVPSNQSDVTKLRNADWMAASTTSSKTADGTIKLDFKHQLAKVVVKISGYQNEYASVVPTVSNPLFFTPSSLTNVTGKTVSIEGSATKVKAFMQQDTSTKGLHSFMAILPTGTYTIDDTFMQLMVNDSVLNVKANAKTLIAGLEAGKSYTFNLIVGKDKVVVSAISVTDWLNGGNLDGGKAEETTEAKATTADYLNE